ncbi:GNAT family N-acetyltransferase [Streptomyces sp. NPDC058471]|uniref:GNAT family N-acetyltransferase n=1 Tax=Streptomyces sp. NPDC058471 TaxID=3346516 RepID=UPI003653CC48
MIVYREMDPGNERDYWVSWRWGEGGVVAETETGEHAGYLVWYPPDHRLNPNEIRQVTVSPAFRRQGVATELFRQAQKVNPGIQHSRIRTAAGDLWAKSTGDEVPVRYSYTNPPPPWRFDEYAEDIKHKIEKEAAFA